MNRAISGTVVVAETDRPLCGLILLALLIGPGEPQSLGTARTGPLGRFRLDYPPIAGPADLAVLVYSSGGDLLWADPVHRSIGGAELRIQIEVPRWVIPGELH